jgi:type II secretory pathway component GspD/PulD (secretin)
MRRIRMLPLVVLFLSWSTLAVAAPVPSDTEKKGETPNEKTRKALDQLQDLEIVDQPLPAAVTALREQTKIQFVLDTNTIMMFLGDPNSFTVNIKQKNVKVRTALRSVLNQYHLSYAILGDSVVITTEDAALQRQMRQRVSLDLDAVPLSDALKQLGRETATNVLVDAKVKKEADTAVTLQLDDVPLETAVRLLSEMVGLKPVRMGNVLYITSKATATELRGEPDLISGQPGGGPGQPVPTYPPVPGFGNGGLPPGVGGIAPGIAPPPPAVVPEVPKEKDEKKDEKPKDKEDK